MLRYIDVKSLLDHTEQKLEIIKKCYDQALHEKNISDFLRIDIKNVMENLRSALEYMAHDIAQLLPGKRNKVYFPFGKNQQDFSEALKRNLPELQNHSPDIYLLIEGIQLHKCGNSWLDDLCTTVNQKKHNLLLPQERVTQTTYDIKASDGEVIISAPAGEIEAPPGEIAIEGIPISFDPKTGIPLETDGLNIGLTIWVSFVFQDTKIQVFPLLVTALEEIKKLSNNLYAMLHLSTQRVR